MFGHSAMMFRKGCYIDTGDLQGGTGDVANPTPDNSNQEPPEAEPDHQPDGDADNADQQAEEGEQQRTSKQPPEVDAAYAEARRAKQKAEQLENELQGYKELMAEYEEFGLRDPKQVASVIRQQKQQQQANFAQQQKDQLAEEVRYLRQQGHDDFVIDMHIRTRQAEQRVERLEFEARQRDESLKTQQIQSNIEKQLMSEFNELTAEYPELKKYGSPDGLVKSMDEKTLNAFVNRLKKGYTMLDAYELTNKSVMVDRHIKKTQANLERSTSSGRAKGDAMGGTYGLTTRQQYLAKEGGMTYKEYAAYLQHIKK